MEPKLDELNIMINNYYEKHQLPWADYITLVQCVQNLEKEIQKTLPGTRLNIGGSLCNGFATKESDLDLIFRLADDNPPQNCDEWEMLQKLSNILTELGFQNEVINAKVNIVKCAPSKFIDRSIDICYYNTLALHNVRLMAKYCDWDSRLSILGLWVKNWSKVCNIGDASAGTLSSYAWTITLIHFLQNCSPAVLPRLQEDFQASQKAEYANNCNVYFHKKVELNWSQNTQSVAELFIGFLDYLLNFDYHRQVIQIRRKEPVTKEEKSWNTTLCIEDPFLLSHNMAGRNRTVIATIWETIRLTKELFISAQMSEPDLLFLKCRFEGDIKEIVQCKLCKRMDFCKDTCENKFKRDPNWKSDDARRRLKRLKQNASAQPMFHQVHHPGLAYPMMIPSYGRPPQFVVPVVPLMGVNTSHSQLMKMQFRQVTPSPGIVPVPNRFPLNQPQLGGIQQQMQNLYVGAPYIRPTFTNEDFPAL